MKIVMFAVALFVTACGAQATPVPATRGAAAPPATATSEGATAATAVPELTRPTGASTSAPAATAGAASEFTDAAGNRILGKADAPVTITDYSDFL